MKRAWPWLLSGTLALFLGSNLVTLTSMKLLALGMVVALIGIGLLAAGYVRLDSGPTRATRQRVALVVVASAIGIIGFLVPFLLTRMGSNSKVYEHFDAELGWVPPDTDTVLGRRQQKVDPKREQIIVVGDSIFYGMGVGDNDTAPAVLERMLPPHYQVINIAIPGYSIDQYLIYLKRVMKLTRPKLIILGIFPGNDFEGTVREYGWGHSKPMYVPDGQGIRLLRGNLLEENCIDRLAQSVLFRVVWSDRKIAHKLIDTLCHTRSLDLAEAEFTVAKLFDAIADVGRQAQVPVLFSLFPEVRQFPFVQEFDHRYTSMYPHLLRILRDGGHQPLEYAEALARSKQPLDDAQLAKLYLDAGHFFPPGHKIIAEELYRAIVDRKLLPDVPPLPAR